MGPKNNIYIIYASQDKDLAHTLLRNFQLLEKDFNVSILHDRPIYPNQQWKPQNIARLHEADIFLLLVSNAFMYSEFIQQDEFKMVIDKYKEDKATVIPILLDNCPWDIEFNSDDYDFSFKELAVLPEDRNPMANWEVLKEAINHVSAKVKKLIASSGEAAAPELPSKSLEKKIDSPVKETQVALDLIGDNGAKKETVRNEKGAINSTAKASKKNQKEAERKRKVLQEKKHSQEAKARVKTDMALKENQAVDAKKNLAYNTENDGQAEDIRIAFEKKVSQEKAEARKIAEEERRLEQQAEAKKIAFEKRSLREEAEAKKRAEQKLRLKEAAQANKKEEQLRTAKEATEAETKVLEEKRQKEAAETKRKENQLLKEKETAEAKRKALEEKRQKEKAEAKIKEEQQLKEKETAEAKRKEEQQLKESEAAEVKRRAIKEKRIRTGAKAKKKVAGEPVLEEKPNLQNSGLKATRRERLNNIINNSEVNRPDETENNGMRKKVYVALGIGALAIVGIWLFSLIGTSTENAGATLPETNTSAIQDSVITAKSKVNDVKEEESLSKLMVGDSYGGGLIFALDPSGTSGKIAYNKDAGPMSWKSANSIHEQLGEGWRLPTLDELQRMYRTIGQGASNSGKFANELYWSATPYDTYQARLLKFTNGNASYHYNKAVESREFRVRAVRDF